MWVATRRIRYAVPNSPIYAQTQRDLPTLSPYLSHAFRKVVHEGGNAAEARDLYETLRNASPAA